MNKQRKTVELYEEQADDDGIIRGGIDWNVAYFDHIDIDDVFDHEMCFSEFNVNYQVGPVIYQTDS